MLLEKLLKAGTKDAAIISESKFFKTKDYVTTDLPILNVAFSGKVDGGLVSGLTILAGESKTFKSALSLYCMAAYLKKYPDAVAIFYDTEFGITTEYLESFDIDISRVIHIPVENVEALKFDFVKKLETIERGDRVFFLVDSIGQISSKKEVEDALDEKSVADMTRAKAIRSLLRLITIQLSKKDIPCIMVNHVYRTMEMFSKIVIPGGTAVTYSSNQIFVITKSQEKDKDGTLGGWKFTLNIEKSRFVKEKSKLPFQVMYDGGIQKYSGLLDLALEGKFAAKPKNGWYQLIDQETGEFVGKSYREAETGSPEFLGSLLDSQKFKDFISNKFTLAASEMIVSEEALEEAVDNLIEADLENDDE